MIEFVPPSPSEDDRKRTELLDLSDAHPELRASYVQVAAWGPGEHTWYTPAGCFQFDWCDAIGGGGSGGIQVYSYMLSTGGGGGAYVRAQNVPVSPGQAIVMHIGSGGAGQTVSGANFWPGFNGGSTIVDGICAAEAGYGGGNTGVGGAGGRVEACWAWPGGYAYAGGRGGNLGGQQCCSGGGGAAGPSGPGWNGIDGSGVSIQTAGGNGGNGAGGAGSPGIRYNSDPGGAGMEYAAWGPWGSGGGSGGAFYTAGQPVAGAGGNYGGGGGGCVQTAVFNSAVTVGGGPGLVVIAYRMFSAIVVSSCAPASGGTSGGTYVTIYGSGFEQIQNVTFGGVSATGITVHNDNTITCYAPGHTAGPVNVSVFGTYGRQGDGYSLYTYFDPPSVTGNDPISGPTSGGQYVTVYGSGFTNGVQSVIFGDTAATGIVVHSANVLTCYTPARAAVGVNITVNTTYGSAVGGAYTFVNPPSVSTCTPNRGNKYGGTAVTITGAYLTGVNTVTFGGVPATSVVVVNDNTITCVTPAVAAAGVVNIVASNGYGAGTGVGLFTYVSLPEVTSCVPNIGPEDLPTPVTITGANFTGTTGVTFGGTAATGLVVVSDTTITCNAPPHLPGTVDIVVTNIDGSGTGTNLFSYLQVLQSALKIAIIMS